MLAARAIQAKRYAPQVLRVCSATPSSTAQVRRVCRMTPAAERLLRASYDALGLSARAHDRILRVARTVADLAGKQLLDEDCVLEALQYRHRKKWKYKSFSVFASQIRLPRKGKGLCSLPLRAKKPSVSFQMLNTSRRSQMLFIIAF